MLKYKHITQNFIVINTFTLINGKNLPNAGKNLVFNLFQQQQQQNQNNPQTIIAGATTAN